ncbi:MAG TPA: FtsK/SpoIIIE domain-containing protein [Jatrophihabitantaceae bacterium]|nr:FtsK/SpoIIIE domain-containing protein [Jatrophihabitantaceae bacterium]
MDIRLSVRDQDGFTRDVALAAPSGAALRDVSDGIASLMPGADGTIALWSGSQRLPPTALLGGPGLRDGGVLQLGRPGARDLTAGAVIRIHVVGGPDAGLIVALPRGVLIVGRSPACDLVLTDPDVSRQHAALTVTTAGISVRDLGSTNGTHLDGTAVDADGAAVRPGQLLRLGDSLLRVSGADEPAAAVRDGPDGTQLVNRPPRLAPQLPDREVIAPVRQLIPKPQRVQWLAALLPTLLGVGLALAMHSVQFLAFALLSPVLIVATAAGDRLHWRRTRRQEAHGFRRREAEAQRERVQLLAAEMTHRRRAHADPAAVLRTATIPDCRLWERRRTDPDMLDLRLGMGDAPSALRIRRGAQVESAGVVQLVPSVVTLRAGPLGIAGPPGIALGTARWALAQVAVLHSPMDVRVVLLLSDAAAQAWMWARWLPHLGGNVAVTAEQHAGTVAELSRVVSNRLAQQRHDASSWTGQWIVLVVDRAGALADVPGLAQLLTAGPAVGVTAISLDEDERRLPTACVAVARVRGDTGTRLGIQQAGSPEVTDVINDRVGTRWAERVARALAPMVDASTDAASAIPAQCRLLDILELSEPTSDELVVRWSAGCRPATTLGVGAEGAVAIDLERDGPHTLIAGTTGAGKSELLQSLIAGLATANSPEAVSFVLIDYKGGAAFADCARLPHSVGLVTDLDSHLTRRALQSLDAELRRREALFAAAGAKDLAVYRASPHQARSPLGRLVLVVDEFAALAEELPDFITGLIAVAQRGRSLGLHLVLATQRPGGVISPEIRANSALRIALRVTDPGESTDVIGTDVAATIDKHRPGRAFVRTGTALTEIQTARVSGAAPSGVAQVRVLPLDDWGRPVGPDITAHGEKTDLQLLVDAICEAAARTEVTAAAAPWREPLPARLPAADLEPRSHAAVIPVGRIDLPGEQRQAALSVDLRVSGPMLIVGSPRSGRSTTLRTLAGMAAAGLAPDDLHLYVIDCGGGGQRILAHLAHCGAVIDRGEFGTAERLLARLTSEIAQRQTRLIELGVSSVAEARECGHAIPFVLVIVDGWEGFVAAAEEHDAGRSVETLLALIRDSAAAGFTIAIAGDRATLTARIAGIVARKYVLRLADRADYALAGLPPRAVPTSMPPGRAICAETGAEVQLAFLGADPSAAGQQRALRELSAMSSPEPHRGLIRIRPLPTRVELAALGSVKQGMTVLGVGGDESRPVAIDLFTGDARLIIAGPRRSGRSTVLRLVLDQLRNRDVLVAAPRRSPLVEAAQTLRIRVVTPDDPATAIGPYSGQLLLVDDSETFLDTQIGDALTDLLRSGRSGLAAVVAARSDELAVTYRGVGHEARRSRAGLLLQPEPGDGELLGLRLPRTYSTQPPGRGVLVVEQAQLQAISGGAAVLPIQVALP